MAFEGEVFVMVDPTYRRRGIGTRLLREASKRWNLDLRKQHYTPSGAAFVDKLRQDESKEKG